MIQTAGRHKIRVVVRTTSEHAEHDRADKGESDIRGDDAQSADQGTKGHWQTSQIHFGVHDLPAVTRKLAGRSTPKKSALLSIRGCRCALFRATWLKSREINALKSP